MSDFVMGNRIKTMRLSCNLTMEELGAKLGVGKSAVNKWEKGLVRNIKRSTIAEMAKLFDVSPIWLMGLDEEIASYDTAFDYEKDWAAKGGSVHQLKLTPEEEKLIQDIRNSDRETKILIERVLYPRTPDIEVKLKEIPKLEEPVKLKPTPQHIPYLGDNISTKKVSKVRKSKEDLA